MLRDHFDMLTSFRPLFQNVVPEVQSDTVRICVTLAIICPSTDETLVETSLQSESP